MGDSKYISIKRINNSEFDIIIDNGNYAFKEFDQIKKATVGVNTHQESSGLGRKTVTTASIGVLTKGALPLSAEMVTASASGLDPNITPQCAYVQVKRVAQARGLTENQVKEIVDQSVEKPLLGIFGTEKINVLKLNIALEENK